MSRLGHKNQSVNVHQFAMAPRADIPRSSFRVQKTLKTTFDGGYLIPIYCDEILPGDTFNLNMTAFARLSTPLFPFMDNLHLDCFFFFIPNRLVWTNWVKFMGQQASPGDSIAYTIPQIVSTAGGYGIQTVYDYFGLPTAGQVTAGLTVSHNVLPLRGYRLVYDQWFRDENLQTGTLPSVGDGPDSLGSYVLYRRGKRHDYFTSCLPFVQKGTVTPLIVSGVAPVTPVDTSPNNNNIPLFRTASVATPAAIVPASGAIAANLQSSVASSAEAWQWTTQTGLEVDLANATANTINQLRQAFQIQKLLERDARGGTRYTEIVRSHFGVISPDARLQRSEYLGGSSAPITVNPVAQTAAEAGAVGDLGAAAVGLLRGGFSQSFTEHGYVLGLISARADLTYQQGLRKMWSRSTRYDFYFPVFAALGEQAVLTKEIYCTGDPAIDDDVFGYQERWAEYRYNPSEITGYFRSTAANTLDAWHLAQEFSAQPVLNASFIVDDPPIARVVAATGNGFVAPQFLLDCFFDIREARAMPLYSVPGMIDHF